jgi:hypothetical protein
MARVVASTLDTGDLFPVFTIDTVHHGQLRLPDSFQGSWGVVLVYRAHW